jgi:hypothetical protein
VRQRRLSEYSSGPVIHAERVKRPPKPRLPTKVFSLEATTGFRSF